MEEDKEKRQKKRQIDWKVWDRNPEQNPFPEFYSTLRATRRHREVPTFRQTFEFEQSEIAPTPLKPVAKRKWATRMNLSNLPEGTFEEGKITLDNLVKRPPSFHLLGGLYGAALREGYYKDWWFLWSRHFLHKYMEIFVVLLLILDLQGMIASVKWFFRRYDVIEKISLTSRFRRYKGFGSLAFILCVTPWLHPNLPMEGFRPRGLEAGWMAEDLDWLTFQFREAEEMVGKSYQVDIWPDRVVVETGEKWMRQGDQSYEASFTPKNLMVAPEDEISEIQENQDLPSTKQDRSQPWKAQTLKGSDTGKSITDKKSYRLRLRDPFPLPDAQRTIQSLFHWWDEYLDELPRKLEYRGMGGEGIEFSASTGLPTPPWTASDWSGAIDVVKETLPEVREYAAEQPIWLSQSNSYQNERVPQDPPGDDVLPSPGDPMLLAAQEAEDRMWHALDEHVEFIAKFQETVPKDSLMGMIFCNVEESLEQTARLGPPPYIEKDVERAFESMETRNRQAQKLQMQAAEAEMRWRQIRRRFLKRVRNRKFRVRKTGYVHSRFLRGSRFRKFKDKRSKRGKARKLNYEARLKKLEEHNTQGSLLWSNQSWTPYLAKRLGLTRVYTPDPFARPWFNTLQEIRAFQRRRARLRKVYQPFKRRGGSTLLSPRYMFRGPYGRMSKYWDRAMRKRKFRSTRGFGGRALLHILQSRVDARVQWGPLEIWDDKIWMWELKSRPDHLPRQFYREDLYRYREQIDKEQGYTGHAFAYVPRPQEILPNDAQQLYFEAVEEDLLDEHAKMLDVFQFWAEPTSKRLHLHYNFPTHLFEVHSTALPEGHLTPRWAYRVMPDEIFEAINDLCKIEGPSLGSDGKPDSPWYGLLRRVEPGFTAPEVQDLERSNQDTHAGMLSSPLETQEKRGHWWLDQSQDSDSSLYRWILQDRQNQDIDAWTLRYPELYHFYGGIQEAFSVGLSYPRKMSGHRYPTLESEQVKQLLARRIRQILPEGLQRVVHIPWNAFGDLSNPMENTNETVERPRYTVSHDQERLQDQVATQADLDRATLAPSENLWTVQSSKTLWTRDGQVSHSPRLSETNFDKYRSWLVSRALTERPILTPLAEENIETLQKETLADPKEVAGDAEDDHEHLIPRELWPRRLDKEMDLQTNEPLAQHRRFLHNGLLMPHGMIPRELSLPPLLNYAPFQSLEIPDFILRGNVGSCVTRSKMVRELLLARATLLEHIAERSNRTYACNMVEFLGGYPSTNPAENFMLDIPWKGDDPHKDQKLYQNIFTETNPPLTPEELALLDRDQEELDNLLPKELEAHKTLKARLEEHTQAQLWLRSLTGWTPLSTPRGKHARLVRAIPGTFGLLARINYLLGSLISLDQYPQFEPWIGLSKILDDQVEIYRAETKAALSGASKHDRNRLAALYQELGENSSLLTQDIFLAETLDSKSINRSLADHLERIRSAVHPAGWRYLYGWDKARSPVPSTEIEKALTDNISAKAWVHHHAVTLPKRELAVSGTVFQGNNLETTILKHLEASLPAKTFASHGAALAHYVAQNIYAEESYPLLLEENLSEDELRTRFYKLDNTPSLTSKPPKAKSMETVERATKTGPHQPVIPDHSGTSWVAKEKIHKKAWWMKSEQMRSFKTDQEAKDSQKQSPFIDLSLDSPPLEQLGSPQTPHLISGDESLFMPEDSNQQEQQEWLNDMEFTLDQEDTDWFLDTWRFVQLSNVLESWARQSFHPGTLNPILRERFQTGFASDQIPRSLWQRWRKDHLEWIEFHRSGTPDISKIMTRPGDPTSVGPDYRYQSKASLLTSLLGHPQERLGDKLAYALVPPRSRPPILSHAITAENEQGGKVVWSSNNPLINRLPRQPDSEILPESSRENIIAKGIRTPKMQSRKVQNELDAAVTSKAMMDYVEENWPVKEAVEDVPPQRWYQRRRRRRPWPHDISRRVLLEREQGLGIDHEMWKKKDLERAAESQAFLAKKKEEGSGRALLGEEFLGSTVSSFGSRSLVRPVKPRYRKDPLYPWHNLEGMMAKKPGELTHHSISPADVPDHLESLGSGYARPLEPHQASKIHGDESLASQASHSLSISSLLDMGRHRPSRDVLELPSAWVDEMRSRETIVDMQRASQEPVRLIAFGDIIFQIQEGLAGRPIQNVFRQFLWARFHLPECLHIYALDSSFLKGHPHKQNLKTATYRVLPNLLVTPDEIVTNLASTVFAYLSVHQFAFMTFHLFLWFVKEADLAEMFYLLGTYLLKPFKWHIVFSRRRKRRRFRFDIFRPKTSFLEMAGVDDYIDECWDVVSYLYYSHFFYRKLGLHRKVRDKYILPKAILLGGPPGTGKTFFVKAIAGQSKVPVLSIEPVDLVAPKLLTVTRRLHALFDIAEKMSPCIIFIDEIELVARQRKGLERTAVGKAWARWESNGFDMAHEELFFAARKEDNWESSFQVGDREPGDEAIITDLEWIQEWIDPEATGLARDQANLLLEFIVRVDNLDPYGGVMLIGATNFSGYLDGALMRPGRFTRELNFSLPNAQRRMQLFRFFQNKSRENSDRSIYEGLAAPAYLAPTDLATYLFRTEGFNQADLAVIHNETVLQSAFLSQRQGMSNLRIAMDRVQDPAALTDISKKFLNLQNPLYSVRSAYHQAARGIVFTLLSELPPVLYLDLHPRTFRLPTPPPVGANGCWSGSQLESWMVGQLVSEVSQRLMMTHTKKKLRITEGGWPRHIDETLLIPEEEEPGDLWENLTRVAYFLACQRTSFSNQVLAQRFGRVPTIQRPPIYLPAELARYGRKLWRPWRRLWSEPDPNDLFKFPLGRDKWTEKELDEGVEIKYYLQHWMQWYTFHFSHTLDYNAIRTRPSLMLRRYHKRDTHQPKEAHLREEYRSFGGHFAHVNEQYQSTRDELIHQILSGAFARTWGLLISNRPLWDYLARNLLFFGTLPAEKLVEKIMNFSNLPELIQEKFDKPYMEPGDILLKPQSKANDLRILGSSGPADIKVGTKFLQMESLQTTDPVLPPRDLDLLEVAETQYFADFSLTQEEQDTVEVIWRELNQWNAVVEPKELRLVPMELTNIYAGARDRMAEAFIAEWNLKIRGLKEKMLLLDNPISWESSGEMRQSFEVILDLLGLMEQALEALQDSLENKSNVIMQPTSFSRAKVLFKWPFRLLELIPEIDQGMEVVEKYAREWNFTVPFTSHKPTFITEDPLAQKTLAFLDELPTFVFGEWAHDLLFYGPLLKNHNRFIFQENIDLSPMTREVVIDAPEFWESYRAPEDTLDNYMARTVQELEKVVPLPWTRLIEPFQALEQEAQKVGLEREEWQEALSQMMAFPVEFHEHSRALFLGHLGILRMHFNGFNDGYRKRTEYWVKETIPKTFIPPTPIGEIAESYEIRKPGEDIDKSVERLIEADLQSFVRARRELKRMREENPEISLSIEDVLAKEQEAIKKHVEEEKQSRESFTPIQLPSFMGFHLRHFTLKFQHMMTEWNPDDHLDRPIKAKKDSFLPIMIPRFALHDLPIRQENNPNWQFLKLPATEDMFFGLVPEAFLEDYQELDLRNLLQYTEKDLQKLEEAASGVTPISLRTRISQYLRLQQMLAVQRSIRLKAKLQQYRDKDKAQDDTTED
uniref:Hypothetical chloroplast RF2 n=1 Tax=Nephroselmis pyriformis TaxID=156128 RepID=A0A8A2H7S3_9CHLO|nr:hypothetical chloroplast RF2 [Nephroselmis pyriformis]QSV37248.1 hypothetical chloroplast RF2 [Nephroselmis pyriformis]